METPNFYAIIPATVRYCEDLIPTAKLLYGEITALCNERGFCWANNSHFAKLYNVSDFTVSRWISQLESKGFIRVEIDKSAGNQRHIYINDSVPLLRKSARGIDEKRKTLLTKSARPSCGKAQDPIDEKRKQNNIVNNKENNTVSSAARAEKQRDVEKEKGKKAPQIAGAPPAGPTGPTVQPTTFSQSIWSTATTGAFAQALHDYAPETADADAGYYRNRCRDWSAQNPGKLKPDWIAFAAQIINDDRGKNKLVTIQPIQTVQNGIRNQHHSQGSSGEPLVNIDRLRDRAREYADRFNAKNAGRHKH